MTSGPVPFEVFRPGIYLHGTKAVLVPGEVLEPWRASNFEDGRISNHIYIVEPIGEIEDDPNLTDKRFPGNPTHSYRTREPVRIVSELQGWTGHSSIRSAPCAIGLPICSVAARTRSSTEVVGRSSASFRFGPADNDVA